MSSKKLEMAESHPQPTTAAGARGKRLKGFFKRNLETLVYIYLVAAIVAAGLFMSRLESDSFMSRQRQLVQQQAAGLASNISEQLVDKAILMRALVALINNDPKMSQDSYAKVAGQLVSDYPGIVDIAAAPGLVVRYVYPADKNSSVLGFDYTTSKQQYPDVLRAKKTGQTVITGPIKLVQGGTGFIIRTPVFLTSGQGKPRKFWGIVSAVIDAGHFYNAAGLTNPNLPLSIALRRVNTHVGNPGLIFGDAGVFDRKPVITMIDLAEGDWELASIPKNGWPHQSPVIWLYRGAYVLMVLLILAAIRFMAVTHRRRRLAERRLSDAINALDDGFVLYDENDRLVVCNRKYREFYSTTSDLFVPGTPFEKIVREGLRRGQFTNGVLTPEQWARERLAAHHKASSETEQQLGDGRWLKVADRKTPDGSTVGLRVDVTPLKNAMDAAQAANIAKSEFLNVLSHELRTPLTVILGNARILRYQDKLPQVSALRDTLAKPGSDPVAAAQVETALAFLGALARKIEVSSEHLLYLITDMLDFSKIEAGKMELDPETLELRPLVEGMLDGFRDSAAKKGLALVCEVEDLNVMADRVRLNQILINLVGNAMKFTDRGEIRLSSRVEGEMVEITVSDTGCGIAPEHLDIVFDRFRQVDASSTRKAAGTGLGLAITRRLVELHGGQIHVSSVPGKGSEFRLTIPLAAAGSEGRAAPQAAQA